MDDFEGKFDEIDYPDEYYDSGINEPYKLEEDQGYGTCAECGSYLENWGACSDGDGDLYDEIGCPNCQETRWKKYAPGYDPDSDDFWMNFVDDDDGDIEAEQVHRAIDLDKQWERGNAGNSDQLPF